jgi:hypothetical protein
MKFREHLFKLRSHLSNSEVCLIYLESQSQLNVGSFFQIQELAVKFREQALELRSLF